MDTIKRDRYLHNLGQEGRMLLVKRASMDWQTVPRENRLAPLMAMRERGLLTVYEFHELAEHIGYTSGQADGEYRKWTGTQEAIWEMKYRDMLRPGEYTSLLRAKKITKGAGYYRARRYAALRYGLPFRGMEKKSPAVLRSRRNEQP